MNERLLAHRFRILEVLDESSSSLLARARDVAAEQDGWLLRLGSVGRSLTHASTRLRLRQFARSGLGRELSPRAELVHEDELLLFFDARSGARPLSAVLEGGTDLERRLQELRDLLQSLLSTGRCCGQLALRRVWVDDEGVFLLPTAYAIARPRSDFVPVSHADAAREAQELWSELASRWRGLHRDGRVETSDLPVAGPEPGPEAQAPGPGSATAVEVREALDALAPEGGCLTVAVGSDAHGLSEVLRDEARRRGRFHVELEPHVGPVPRKRRSEEPGLLVVLRGARDHASFAEGLSRLESAGWLDGRELLVLLAPRPVDDATLELFRRSYAQRRELSPEEAEPPALEPHVLGGLAHRIREALEIADRPLSDRLLASAFSLDPTELVDAIAELEEHGLARTSFTRHEECGGGPTVVLHRRRGVDLSPSNTRREAVRILLAAALERLGRRSGAGRLWLLAESALAAGSDEAGDLLRKLARHSQSEGLDLLGYAAYSRLLERAEVTRPRLEDRCGAAICMAEQHRMRGDVETTERILREALEEMQARVEAPPEKLAPLVCDLALELVHLELHRSRFQSAEDLLKATLERYRDYLPGVQRARIYLDLSWALIQLGRTRESMDQCHLALRLVDTERHVDLVARAYNQLGYAQYKESDYRSSIKCFERALVLREQSGDDLAVARTYNNLSLSQRALGQFHDAEFSIQESLRLKRRVGDQRGVAASLLNLGFVYRDQERWREARDCARQCLRLAESMQHLESEAEAYGLLGEISEGQGQLEEARRYLQRDLDICRATGHDAETLATLRRLVSVLLQTGAVEEAAEHLERARELLVRQPSRYEAALLDDLEARLFRQTGALDPAADAWGSAARIFGSLRRWKEQVGSLTRRAEVEWELGRTSAVRRTLAEIRDLAVDHEIHSLPESIRELEAKLGQGGGEGRTLGGDEGLSRLAQVLSEVVEDPDEPLRPLLQSVTTSLAADAVLWVKRRPDLSLEVREGAASARAIPPELRGLLEEGTDLSSGRVRTDGWSVLPAGVEEWLCVHGPRDFDHAELDFLRSIARLLTLLGHPGVTEHPAANAPRARVEKAEPEVDGVEFVGRSAAIRHVLQTAQSVAHTDVTVLLLGENGTGKDLVARSIHQMSPRREGEFLALNCASIPSALLESELFGHEKGAFTSAHERRPGVFERADGGTIFLDEIAEMPLAMQAKLLRVLQDRRFTRVGGTQVLESDVRVLAATNRKLMEEVRQGRFRMDLYFRLNVVSLEIPPLRDRGEDIELLAGHFVERHGPALESPARRFSREALARFREYDWPGNVRELENVVKNALVFAQDEVIRLEDLPQALSQEDSGRGALSVEAAVRDIVQAGDWSEERPLVPRVELLLVHEAVRRLGNKTLAAKLLGITKPTLYSRLRRFEALYGDASGREEEGGRS